MWCPKSHAGLNFRPRTNLQAYHNWLSCVSAQQQETFGQEVSPTSQSGLQTIFGEVLDTSKMHICSCHSSIKFSCTAWVQALRRTFIVMLKRWRTKGDWSHEPTSLPGFPSLNASHSHWLLRFSGVVESFQHARYLEGVEDTSASLSSRVSEHFTHTFPPPPASSESPSLPLIRGSCQNSRLKSCELGKSRCRVCR